MKVALIIALIITVTISGDYALKLASQRKDSLTSLPFMLGGALYFASAVGFTLAMKEMTLASIGVFYAVGTIVLMAFLGVVVFKEGMTGRELTGIVLALTSIGFLVRFT